jgi:nucleoside-diphosphate-sugar epimerase
MMKNNSCLITGGCGFVGRNLIRKLKKEEDIWVIDDLSIGLHPEKWLDKGYEKIEGKKNYSTFKNKKRKIHFIFGDVIDILKEESDNLPRLPYFKTIFHLASIVGGRETIDGDPILVGKDHAIDSLFFYWLTRKNRDAKKVLYASSSAAYPIVFQGKNKHKALKESHISFTEFLGMPDMTYGWSKLTGEYISRLAASQYGISIACVRPFSGYGEDQDFSYPIPAITRRIAKRENPLAVWGTGKQQRDFIHIDDCIDAFFIIMKKIKDGSACNIGSGKSSSFIDIIKLLSKIEGYNPKIITLKDKPVGVSSRYADISLLTSYGWEQKIDLEDGLKRVLTHIKKNRL